LLLLLQGPPAGHTATATTLCGSGGENQLFADD
jgi:hypothetical protein